MSRTPTRCIGLLVLLAVPLQARQEGSLERFPRWLLTDPIAVVRDARAPDYLLAGGAAAVLLPLSRIDEPLRRAVSPPPAGVPDFLLRTTNHLGEGWGVAASALVFGGTLLTDDQRLQNVAFSSVQSAAYAGATALMLKWTVGRSRPSAGRGAYHFRPGQSFDDAFPSGHTAVAFALTVPWVRAYPSSPSWLLLAAAVGTGAARIAYDRHWLTDVLGGAALGAGMGYVVVGRRLSLD